MTKAIRHTIARFGVALSLIAAVSVFAHSDANHAADASESDHACAVCRVVTVTAGAPVVAVAPTTFVVETLAFNETPGVTSQPTCLHAGRGPPSL